jgi:very-short-patch-repair endonuclease
MNPEVMARIGETAEQQHGAIGRAQLEAAGTTPWDVRRLLQRGVLARAAPRAFVLAGSPATLERSLHVGLLSLGPDAVVSHEAAARLHGFDRCLSDAVEFTVPRRARGLTSPFRVHTTLSLPALDVVRVAGLRCTSATRTILDLAAAGISTVRLEAAVDSAVRDGLSAPSVLARHLAERRGPGHRGVRQVEALLPDSGGHTRLERAFLSVVRRAGLPRPMTQVVHRRDRRTFARVDFLFDAADVVVEVSGRRGHASDAERARDAQRRIELQAIGRRVYEFTTADVHDRPADVVAFLRAHVCVSDSVTGSPNR